MYEFVELFLLVVGLLIVIEFDVFDCFIENLECFYVVVFGGFKVSDKLGVILYLLLWVDWIFVGGGMLFMFLKV